MTAKERDTGMKLLLLTILAVTLSAQSTPPAVSLIKTVPKAAATYPVAHMQVLALATLATGSTTASMALPSTQIPSMGCIVYFESSQVGQDVFQFLPTCAGPITFTLPTYATFAAAPLDQVTLIYWGTT